MDKKSQGQVSIKSKSNDADVSKIVSTFVNILEDLISNNEDHFDIPDTNTVTSIFYSRKPPKIGLKDYLMRFVKYSAIEASTLIVSLILLDTFSKDQVCLSNLSIHRLLVTTIVIAIKMNEDEIYKNDYYASIGGISLDLLNSMEFTFVKLFDWRLHVNKETFDTYKKLVE